MRFAPKKTEAKKSLHAATTLRNKIKRCEKFRDAVINKSNVCTIGAHEKNHWMQQPKKMREIS